MHRVKPCNFKAFPELGFCSPSNSLTLGLLLLAFLCCCVWILQAEAESSGEIPGVSAWSGGKGRQPAGRARLVAPVTEVVTLDLPNTAQEVQEDVMQRLLLGNIIKLLDNHTGV